MISVRKMMDGHERQQYYQYKAKEELNRGSEGINLRLGLASKTLFLHFLILGNFLQLNILHY